jgi:hypothetical protein
MSKLSKPVNRISHIILSVSTIVNEIIEENKRDENGKVVTERQAKLIFNAKRRPNISIESYLERIMKYSNMEESSFVFALIYLDTICNKKGIVLTELNIHRLLFTGMLCGIKFNEDDFFDNAYYAKIAGISLSELNKLEYEFLTLMEFSLYIQHDVFQRYHRYLKHYRVKKSI